MKSHYDTILVPTDLSEKSLLALNQSLHLAEMAKLEVTLLHVRQDTKKTFFFSMFSDEETQKMKKEYENYCKEKLQKIAKEYSKKSGIKINTILAKGKVYEMIIRTAEQINAKFICMRVKSERDEEKNVNIGSNTLKVIREAGCPVITLNNESIRKGCKNIVLPLDLSKETKQKVSHGLEIAKLYKDSTIHAVSALLTDQREIVNHLKVQIEQVRRFIEQRGVPCVTELIHGDKNKDTLDGLIVKYAKKIDADVIIIMTQQEMNWTKFFVGSTAQGIILSSDIPVMSIIPKDIVKFGGFN